MLKRFLDFVEIKTKITSIFPFFMVLGYLFYRHQRINGQLTVVFFLSMFLFDLTTTAINNYIDTKTNGQPLQFKRKAALNIILLLFGISTVLGLYLAYRTDWVVFLLGGACFLVGVLYTAGPVPLSRQPLGEAVSGIFYGLLLPFILFYINMPQGTILAARLHADVVSIDISLWPFVTLLLLSVAPVCTTANIMLANNICDVEKDIAVKRYTLPYYLGKKKALSLFAGFYYVVYLAFIAMVAMGILPGWFLLSLLSIVVVQMNIHRFFIKQEKATTFIVSIQNYVIIMGIDVILLFTGGLI